ncbi:MAG: hypothetical protein K2X86_17410 [Cytophagaceae bacterium]|nr:hypothetical protein [Cytophagaceae bacterium]
MKTSKTFLYLSLSFVSVFLLSFSCKDEEVGTDPPTLNILSPTQNQQHTFSTNSYLDFQVDVSDKDLDRLYIRLYRLQTNSYIDSVEAAVYNSKYYKVSANFPLPFDIFFNENFALEAKVRDRMGNTVTKKVDFFVQP